MNPAKARMLTALAIKQGVLDREPCEVCGKEPTDAHHEDYEKPYEVRWVCRMHHRWVHAYGTSVDEQIDRRCLIAFPLEGEAA